LRFDEEYAKNAIEAYLRKESSDFTITEGENPPDYYIQIDSKKIALEITRAEPPSDRKTVDTSLARLCSQINDQFKTRIPDGESLLLDLKGPVANPRNFEKSLSNLIGQIIEGKTEVGNWKCFDVSGEAVKIKRLTHGQKWRKKIIGFIGNKEPVTDIQSEAQSILNKIIKSKEAKTATINDPQGKREKWLGILNTHPLLDSNNFQIAMGNLNVVHTFTRIFLVLENSEVVEIFSNRS